MQLFFLCLGGLFLLAVSAAVANTTTYKIGVETYCVAGVDIVQTPLVRGSVMLMLCIAPWFKQLT